MTNRKLQNIIAAVVILVAMVALLFQNHMEDWLETLKPDNRPVIATIDSLSKGVKYRLPESLTYYRARNHMGLHAKDTVSTDSDSQAVISFKSGLKVELEPNSLMIVEDTAGTGESGLELTFLHGNVKVLNQAPGIKLRGVDLSKVEVKKEPTLKLDLSMLEKAPQATPPPAVMPKVSLEEKKEKIKAAAIKKKIEPKETLPDSYIASVIRNQRTFLNRCYAQHLRLNPDARGRIDTSLTIEPDGTISTARVVGSTIADPTLEQCVVATLQRARFKAFNGDPIIVQYPINFE